LAVPAQKTHLKPVAALIFNFILNQALKHHFTHPLYLSLDEFTNFGTIPAIAQKLSIIRHRNIPVLIGVQDFVQLQQVYGKDDALLIRSQPGTKIFFRPRTFDVAKSISEQAGMTTIYERKVGSSGQITERESGRALIDPAEVMAMDDSKVIVMTPATPPMMLPRFTWRDYEDATDTRVFAPIVKQEVVVDERLVKDEQLAGKPELARRQAAPKAAEADEDLEIELVRKPQKNKKEKAPEKLLEEKPLPKPQEPKEHVTEWDDDFGPAAP
jgi:type IV secretory pathway TraG/TraD family ATPase VirD4